MHTCTHARTRAHTRAHAQQVLSAAVGARGSPCAVTPAAGQGLDPLGSTLGPSTPVQPYPSALLNGAGSAA